MNERNTRLLIGALLIGLTVFYLYLDVPEPQLQDLSSEGFEPGETCQQDADCSLPWDFAIQSNCPFGAACIDAVCQVVCPQYEHAEPISISESSSVSCQDDTDCDCSDRESKSMDCRCHQGHCVSVEG